MNFELSRETPEFLVWAIEYRCPIRGFQDGTDPEKTERQLRAARAVSAARREGRIFAGLCVAPPNAFRIHDALAIYGGLSAVERCCGDCPANSIAESLAGCFGLLPIPSTLHEISDTAFHNLSPSTESLFPLTQPQWYGLWIQSPLDRHQLSFLSQLFESKRIADLELPGIADLQSGIRSALASNLPLHATLFPPGRVAGPWWHLSPHCPRCQALWPAADTRRCITCDYAGHPAQGKKRHARGLRPYFPLAQLLGEQPAAEFLLRYEAFRSQQQSPPPPQTPPHPAQPDNPPAD